MMAVTTFDTISEPLDRRVAVALAKIGTALRSHAWSGAERQGLTPTQGEILMVLRQRGGPLRLTDIAEGLAITRPTASDAVSALVRKGLVAKARDAGDGRAVALRLTVDGVWEAERIAHWPDFLTGAVDTLSPAEQESVYHALLKIIGALQQENAVPQTRMCMTCRFFRPGAHDDPDTPHHCRRIGAPFGRRHLRVDCAEHEAAEPGNGEREGSQ